MRYGNLGLIGVYVAACLVATTATAAPVSPSGKKEWINLRLLTEGEYRHSVADAFGPTIQVQGKFDAGRRVGGLLAAGTTLLSITPASLQAYAKLASNISNQVVNPQNRTRLVPCLPKSVEAPDDECSANFLQTYGTMLFRRPLTTSELQSQVTLARGLAKSSKDFYVGLRYGLSGMLTSPEFLFRVERAVHANDNTYTLDNYSRATRLSFLLWNTAPDGELLKAARDGLLTTEAGLNQQTSRLLASPRIEQGMRAFFSDMLELDKLATTTKDAIIYPTYSSKLADSAKEETLRTVINLTLRSNGDMRDLMTSRKTFIDRTLASNYDIPFTFDQEWIPYEFPQEAGRSGLLTQTSLLSMFSHPGRSSPTVRGAAYMDIFMCEPIPTPPASVDFSVVNETDGALKTVRERLQVHAVTPACASCHNAMDPTGLALEKFDSIGIFRTTENGQPIDVSGKINNKSFDGAVGLGQVLRDNPKIPACFVKKLFSYGTGTDSETITKDVLSDIYKNFSDSGFRLRSLLKAMALSPEFYRVPAPAGNETKLAHN